MTNIQTLRFINHFLIQEKNLLKQSRTKAEFFDNKPSEKVKNIDQNSQESELKSKIVYANQVLRWLLKSLSAYFNQDEWRILWIIKEFKIIQLRNERRLSLICWKSNRKVKTRHVTAIRKFLLNIKANMLQLKVL